MGLTGDIARATGFTAYILVTLSVLLGLALSLRWRLVRRWPGLFNEPAHQFLLLLAAVFAAMHGVSVWLNPLTHLTLRDILVPFVSPAAPIWMGLGILAGYLGLAVAITTWLRPYVGQAWWRRLHYAAFVVFVLATLHGIGEGPDTRTSWAIAIYAVAVGSVFLLVLARLLQTSERSPKPRWRWALLTTLVVAGGVVWTATGPLTPSWNLAAANGLPSSARIPLGIPSLFVPPTLPVNGFTAPFSATVTTATGPNGKITTITFQATFTGRVAGSYRMTLNGREISSGGLSVVSSVATMGPVGNRSEYRGEVTSLDGQHFRALLDSANDSVSYDVSGTFHPTHNPSRVTGTLAAIPVS